MDLNSLPSDSSDMQKKIQNHEINMFNVTKVESKWEKQTYLSIYKSLFVQNSIPLFIAVSPVIVMRTC